MTSKPIDTLLDVDAAGPRLGVEARMVRRLIAERRIRFVRVGRHVRIPESAIVEYIDAHTVQVREPRNRWAS